MASSSSSSESWIHDVFLSFRGEDTRKTFVDHLYFALEQQGIYTYKDDESLPRGEIISPALLKAIRQSRIAIIVFSENYANSSWCLDEVAYIMKCKDENGQTVLPIFYHVDPSDVRKQKGKYGEAFAKYESMNNVNVEFWRKALVDAGNLAGWEITHIANGHESKGIKEIVDNVSSRLVPLFSNVDEDLVGINTRLQDLKTRLELGLDDVRMVGIWGVGGGGKTTLASSIYNDISNNFDGCIFLENIREESSKHGLEKLQEKILCGILKQKQMEIGRVEEGRKTLERRLGHIKVLIVLDDVDQISHLTALAGSHAWFGEGSRIIITTRDIHLLNVHKVDAIHNIKLLNKDEAIKLFRKHAPQDDRPREDYEHLSKFIISYAGGLPLALKVLGSFLCDKDMKEWKSTLARLKEIPDADIVNKLKISYDGLTHEEKELFLDIACFFRGDKKNYAIEILDACGFHPIIGIKVLIQKALISISDGTFVMHDLLQEMGQYIVRGENLKNPEKHTRVWQVEDTLNIFSMDTTTELDKIEAIRIFSDMDDPLPRENRHVVANMKNLRWIEWKGHHATSLPTDFPPRELCSLILSDGQHTRLWNGFKFLPKLRMIKLHGLNNLTTTPDFGGLQNLERFHLNKSPSLEEIHPSIGRLERLVFLLITSCDNLKMFPSITGIKKLDTLSLSKCRKVSKSRKGRSCPNLFVTCLTSCCTNHDGGIKEPFLLQRGSNHLGLHFISKGLRKLILSTCNLGDEDIEFEFWELLNLQELDLSQNLFSRLDFNLFELPRLKWLDVSLCNRLVELSNIPSTIAVLRADYCTLLEIVGDISSCKWLWKASLMGKNKLAQIGDEKLLESMCQGNAIEHHFISLALEHQIRKLFEASAVGETTFTLKLPHKWYNDYCGFLIHCVIEYQEPYVALIIRNKLELENVECNSRNEVFHDRGSPTYIGYMSFSSLRHTKWWNSAYNSIISFSLRGKFEVELVPRKIRGDNRVGKMKGISDCLEFWDEEREDRKTFTIQHDSKSCINILWCPC